MRRFLRTWFRALKRIATATAAALHRTSRLVVLGIRARFVVFASLQDAATRIHGLHRRIVEAQERIAAHQERDKRLARMLQTAEQAATELGESARASAEEMLWSSKATADQIIRTAQDTAAKTLQEARATAEEAVRAGRVWAETTLEDARIRAQHKVDEIEQDAAGRIEPLQVAADRLTADAERMVDEMESRIRVAAGALAAKIYAFEAERERYIQGLAALIARHAETLEWVGHLQADVQERLIPALDRLTKGLSSADTSWLRSLASGATGRDKRAGVPQHPVTARGPDGEQQRLAPRARTSGEITVRHVSSFRQASQLVRALGILHGVRAARLRNYVAGEATFDITMDDGTLAALDIRRLDGFSLDVVEATPNRLVVQIERRQHPFPPG